MPYEDGLEETRGTALVDVSSEPATLTIDDKTYTLRRLTHGDYAAAQQWIRDRKIEAVLRTTKGLSEEMRARTIAFVVTSTMSIMDIWNEFEGECFMLHRGLVEDGKPIPLQFLLDKMDPGHRRTLTTVLLHICGLKADPTPPVADAHLIENTSTPSDPSNGKMNSEPSAATTNGVAPTNSSP